MIVGRSPQPEIPIDETLLSEHAHHGDRALSVQEEHDSSAVNARDVERCNPVLLSTESLRDQQNPDEQRHVSRNAVIDTIDDDEDEEDLRQFFDFISCSLFLVRLAHFVFFISLLC